MGCGSSSLVDADAKARNDAIERELKRERDMMRNEVKMLLLGAGESGKSTVLKQMKLIHHGTYNDNERATYKEIVFSNTIQSMHAVLEALPTLNLEIDPRNTSRRDCVLAFPSSVEGDHLPSQVADALQSLWNDPAIQEAAERSREFQLNDSAVYYFNNLERIRDRGYKPSDQDILRSRVKTTGITQTTFVIRPLTYKLFDVGGQRSERRKWIHCFENVTALLFLVSMSEYDQKLYEDVEVNRMEEALRLFSSICNSRWFAKTSIILFLNKKDIFAEKLPKSPMSTYFPDYKGGANYDQACEYLKQSFLALNESPTKVVFSHFTCATDTKQIGFVLTAVQEILLQQHLRECGMIA